jgi:thymidylate synthase
MTERTFDTIGEAHEWVVKDLIKYGDELITEDGAPTFESEFPISIIVKYPFKEPMISPAYLFSKQKAEEYMKQFTSLTPPNEDEKKNFAYTYFNRLADYPFMTDYGDFLGNGTGCGNDQIKYSIVERLVKDPSSRRAIAITLVPSIDLESHDPPCMQFIHVLIRHKLVNLIAYFRSNDMMSAWGANAYGLAHLQRQICDTINDYMDIETSGEWTGDPEHMPYHMGWLMTISGSAHLYENDGMQLKEFRRVLNV